MKNLIKTLSVLTVTIALSKSTSAMEFFNINNMSNIFQDSSSVSSDTTECEPDFDNLAWMPNYIRKLINICNSLIETLECNKNRIAFTELFSKVHHAFCVDKNKTTLAGPLTRVQAELLETVKNNYTNQLDIELGSSVPDYLKIENDIIGISATKLVNLYKKIHENLIKSKKIDDEKLIKNETYYDIIKLIEKIKNKKEEIKNEAQSMYFNNLLNENNKEFIEFKEKVKTTIKDFIKKYVKLNLLTEMNWIESSYNSISYTFLNIRIDMFSKQSADELLRSYEVILNETKNLISNKKSNINLNKYLKKLEGAHTSFKNKIKNLDTYHIKTPLEHNSMNLKINEQNSFVEFIKENLIEINKFQNELITVMYDENLFDELSNLINKF